MADQSTPQGEDKQPRVGLFVTCLADLVRPNLGFAAIKLLEQAGCTVEVPLSQTCCGQPAFQFGAQQRRRHSSPGRSSSNSSHSITWWCPPDRARGMIKLHYAEVLANDAKWLPRAQALAEKTWELMSFLVHVRGFKPEGVALKASATYHDSCAGLRELGIFQEPRSLLAAVDGLELKPLQGNDVCCGFGGTFCVKYPDISNAVVGEKARAVEATGAELLLGGDLGCLMNIAGKLSRGGSKVRVMHAAEVLAGMAHRALGEED